MPRDDRFWGHIWHRESVKHIGLVDFEYSELSDRAFLGEYFERIAEEEKEQESLVYVRRGFRDNLALTGLFQWRTNDFQTQTERLPEGKAYVFQQPVFGTGLYTDLTAQAAHLRPRPAEVTGLGSRRYERYDIWNQWSYPVHVLSPYLDVRPFSFVRYSYYGELSDPARSGDDRFAAGSGITVSQEWSRIFALQKESLSSRFLGATAVKHVAVPRMTYMNTYTNTLEPERVIGIDDVDTVDLEESFSLSIRNELLTRRRVAGQPDTVRPRLTARDLELTPADYETRRLFESDISLVLYPRRHRDNGGDLASFLRLDNALTIGSVTLRAWLELDPNRKFRNRRTDFSATLRLVPDRLYLIVGDRYTRGRTNVVYADARLWATDKWAFSGYWAHDYERERGVETRIGVTRIFDRFAASFEFVEDVGEDRNRTFYVSVAPVELFRARQFVP